MLSLRWRRKGLNALQKKRTRKKAWRPNVERLEPRLALATVPLTISFTHLHQIGNPDGGIDGDGDYFMEVSVKDSVMAAPVPWTTSRIEDDIFDPYRVDPGNWMRTFLVDDGGLVDITFDLQDFDTFGTGENDHLDINPRPGAKGISIRVDPLTGDYSGDVLSPAFSTQGNGDGYITRIDFDIFVPTVSERIDTDGDGLANTWEIRGIDSNVDGTIDLYLPGGNPFHKDLYVELDAMINRVPQAAALTNVVNSFAGVPNNLVNNPDGQPGIALHFENGGIDESTIPDATWNALDVYGWPTGFDTIKSNTNATVAGGFGTVAERSNVANFANIRAAKALAYRYGIFGNQYGTTGSSGMSELPGNDFFVTLGSFGLTPGSTQERDTQAGTLMHEFGHALGLGHGGEVLARLGTLTVGSATIASIGILDLSPGMSVRGDGIATWLRPQNATLTVGNTAVSGLNTTDGAGRQVLFPGMLVFGTAPGIPPLTGVLTAGSATVTGIANTALLTMGRLVSGVGIPFGTTIASIVASTPTTPGQIGLSNAALASGMQTLTFPTSTIASVNTGTNSITLSNPIQALATLTGTLTAGSTTVTNLPNTGALFNGMPVSGAGIPAGTTVASIVNATTITLSAAPVGVNGPQVLTFSPTTLSFTGTYITGVSSGQVTLNQAATASGTPTLFFTDDTNFKPNYHSVMNYEWQFPGDVQNLTNETPAFVNSWFLDYSRQALPDLDETQLNESTSLGGNPATTVGVVRQNAPGSSFMFQQYVLENASVNWDNDGTPNETGISLDINLDNQRTVLESFEDWSKIVYSFRLNGRDSADGTHSTAIIEDGVAPASVISIGIPQFPTGTPTFVSSATPFSIFATDDQSGVRSASFRFYPQGSPPPDFTSVAGNSAQFTIAGADGSYQVDWAATDNTGNGEQVRSLTITLDNTAPVSTIVQPAATEYAHSDFLTLDYSVSDGTGSGLASFTPTLNGATTLAGHGLADGQVIHLLTELPVGTHTFEIVANDNLGNASTTTVTFEVIVTPESIKEDVRYFLSVGDIKNKGLANSLLAKLNAAARAIERDQCPTAINIYNAFIHELNAQSGKGVAATAAAIMIADAEYLIANCERFVPGANMAMPASALGDFTKDGAVNGADYAVWRKTQGHRVPKHSGADGDGDGVIGQGDFNVWRAHYGMTLSAPGGGSTAVAMAAAVDVPTFVGTTSTNLAELAAVEPATIAQAPRDELPRVSERSAALIAVDAPVQSITAGVQSKTRRPPAALATWSNASVRLSELLITDLALTKVGQKTSADAQLSRPIDSPIKDGSKTRYEALDAVFATLDRLAWVR
jgi:hypothetical protein